jgi:hypothetical protein
MKFSHSSVYSALLLTLVSVTLFSCNFFKEEKKALPTTNTYTLVFMDKTQSVHVDKAFVSQKYQQVLSDLIEQNINRKGDKLEVYFIHENTSKAKALSLTCRSDMENTDAMSATDREGAQTSYDLQIERERMIFLRQATAKLAQQNIAASRRFTDIWASFSVISRAAESGYEVKVYYLSDMIESVKGNGRRDFHEAAPQSDQQAESWAKADAERMKNYSLSNTDIKMVLPFEATSSTKENNPTITLYWTKLLQELGAMSVEEI